MIHNGLNHNFWLNYWIYCSKKRSVANLRTSNDGEATISTSKLCSWLIIHTVATHILALIYICIISASKYKPQDTTHGHNIAFDFPSRHFMLQLARLFVLNNYQVCLFSLFIGEHWSWYLWIRSNCFTNEDPGLIWAGCYCANADLRVVFLTLPFSCSLPVSHSVIGHIISYFNKDVTCINAVIPATMSLWMSLRWERNCGAWQNNRPEETSLRYRIQQNGLYLWVN